MPDGGHRDDGELRQRLEDPGRRDHEDRPAVLGRRRDGARERPGRGERTQPGGTGRRGRVAAAQPGAGEVRVSGSGQAAGWCTNWGAYDVPTLWKMLENEDVGGTAQHAETWK